MDIFLSLISIYVFIFLGFLAKVKLKEELKEKSLVVISIYFLQPMLTFWGLSTRSIDATLLEAPLLYMVVTIFFIAFSSFLAKRFFKDTKERSIASVASAIGNTGNLGIPIGIALFGQESIIYTSLINVANVFIVYTIGVYFYSRGQFSIKESLLNIIKLPLIWFALLALICNLLEIEIHSSILDSLKMGAYAAIVIQLMIFGMFLYSVKLKSINLKLTAYVGVTKFILVPTVSIFILKTLNLDDYMVSVVMLELLVPLAVTNVNLASLYDCKAVDVTALVFLSSLFFIPYILFIMQLFGKL